MRPSGNDNPEPIFLLICAVGAAVIPILRKDVAALSSFGQFFTIWFIHFWGILGLTLICSFSLFAFYVLVAQIDTKSDDIEFVDDEASESDGHESRDGELYLQIAVILVSAAIVVLLFSHAPHPDVRSANPYQ